MSPLVTLLLDDLSHHAHTTRMQVQVSAPVGPHSPRAAQLAGPARSPRYDDELLDIDVWVSQPVLMPGELARALPAAAGSEPTRGLQPDTVCTYCRRDGVRLLHEKHALRVWAELQVPPPRASGRLGAVWGSTNGSPRHDSHDARRARHDACGACAARYDAARHDASSAADDGAHDVPWPFIANG